MWNEVGKQALFAGKVALAGIGTYVIAKGAGWAYGKIKGMFSSEETPETAQTESETAEAQPAAA